MTQRTASPKTCAHCGMGLDGSFEIRLTLIGECDCAAKIPTMPTYRRHHLPDCRLRRLGYDIARHMAFEHGEARVEINEA